VLVDPMQPRRLGCTVLSAELRLRGDAPAAIERDLRNEWLEAVSAAAFDAGATVEGFSGGRLLVLFGAPVPVDQHPVWAMNTAMRMKEAHRVLLGGWSRRRAPAFDAGFGLDCGDVLWSESTLHERRTFAAIGAPVERSAVLATLAGVDEILASTKAFDAVRTVLEKKPDVLWRPVKFRRGESFRLRAGEEPSNAIVVD
jgi:class 3 adenylate cyclase